VKILRLIYTLGSLNVSEVARRVGLNYASAAEHLRVLEGEGLLEVRVYGRVRMYRFAEGSVKAKAVTGLIEAWEKQ
jgi:DNA-binding transcriptional ArsR family regulator